MEMNAIVCELCGSNEITRREDGMYQCDHCGTKYTLEAARQLLNGDAVKIDRSAEVENLLKRAREFNIDGDYKRAYEYAERVLDIDADNEEAKEISDLNAYDVMLEEELKESTDEYWI